MHCFLVAVAFLNPVIKSGLETLSTHAQLLLQVLDNMFQLWHIAEEDCQQRKAKCVVFYLGRLQSIVPNIEEQYILLLGYITGYTEYYLIEFNHQKNAAQLSLISFSAQLGATRPRLSGSGRARIKNELAEHCGTSDSLRKGIPTIGGPQYRPKIL